MEVLELVSERLGESQQPGWTPRPPCSPARGARLGRSCTSFLMGGLFQLCSQALLSLLGISYPTTHSPQPFTFLFGLASSSLYTNSSLLHPTKPFPSSAPPQELSPACVHQDILKESSELAAATFSLPSLCNMASGSSAQ